MKTAINNAKYNKNAMELMLLHYKELHSLLVNNEQDDEIFNTTVLSISYRLDGEFIECFKRLFNSNYTRFRKEQHIYYARHEEVNDDLKIADEIIDEELTENNTNQFINELNANAKHPKKEVA